MAKEEMKNSESKDKKGKSNKGLIAIVVVIAVLVGLAVIGRLVYRAVAQKIAGGVISRVTGQNVNISGNGDNMTIKTDKGDLTVNSGGSLPSDFPSDFPIYPGAKLSGSFSAKGTEDNGGGTGTSVVWETSDDAVKVGTYYKSQLAASGYTIVTEYTSSDSTTLTFEKDKISGFLGVTKGSDGKTAVSVTIGTN